MNIKSDRDYIINILDKVKTGKYVVPEFQRDFVWTTRQIIDLFDSIMKGYPIGSLILWQPESAEFKVLTELGGFTMEKKDSGERLYILDGRQRLTTLISALCEGGSNYSNICINLDDDQVLNVPVGRKQKSNYLSLGVAFDTYELVGYLDYLRQTKLSEEKKKQYAEKAKLVNRKLLSYELGYISVLGGSIDDAVEMFSRVNSKNTQISLDYMLQALAYQPDSDFLFANEISKIRHKLSKFNFDRIDRGLILKCVYHYLDVPFIDGKENMILNTKSSLPTIMDNVGTDVYMAVDFLYNYCGLIDCKMLPYKYQFVMTALFFKNNRTPNDTQLQELRKWFFYTTYTCYFTNTSLAVIREDIKKFRLYSMGQEKHPIDYLEKDFDMSLPDKLQLGSVRTCALAATSILNQHMSQDATLEVFVLPDTGNKTWGNTFFLANKSDSEKLESFLNSKDPWKDDYSKYALSEEIVTLYRKGAVESFLEERTALLLMQETSMLKSLLTPNNSDEMLYGIFATTSIRNINL